MRQRWISPLLWALAALLTIGLAAFQRMTGPSYPVRGEVELAGHTVPYSLPRSHGGPGGLEVILRPPAPEARTSLRWRRFPSQDEWQELALVANGDQLHAVLPHQPPAGKVEYAIELELGGERAVLPVRGTVVARFRGPVPAAVLIPHILAMFLSMLVSTRALLEVVHAPRREGRILVVVAMGLLIAGGFVLGPVVQKLAFGALWTGWPRGTDLTDNKTLIACLAWLPATLLALTRRPTRWAVMVGWTVMMAAFLIPHSLHGSQIDWDRRAETVAGAPP